MILTALNDYYQRLREDPQSGIAAPGYSQERIGYTVVLASDGQVVAVEDEHEHSGKKRLPKRMVVPQPEKRTVAIKANFLWDKTSYVLGVSAHSKRSDQEHDAFKSFHREVLAGCEDAGVKALLGFLQRWDPEHFNDHPQFLRHGETMLDANLVFRLDGESRYMHQRPAALALWDGVQRHAGEGINRRCLVTGEYSRIARLHPAIKGVMGSQSSGASIVSFNLDAFSSYRKHQGDNAPISEQAAFAYTTAMNHLLRRDARNRQCMVIGDTTVIFWAQSVRSQEAERAEDLVAEFMGAGSAEDGSVDDERATRRLHDAMALVRQGRPLRELDSSLNDGAQIYLLGLAPNASRLSIRFWEVQSLAGFARRLADHYRDLELEPPAWKRPPSPQYLALQTAPLYGENTRPKREDVSPLLAGEIARAILSGARYPRSLLGALIMRFRADGQVSALRVALCKAVLSRQARLDAEQGITTGEGEPPVSLDTNHTDPGYLLGRLFSTLEGVQRAALGTVNAGLRDRYYGAASATPASVFPMLLRNVQNHLGKLRKDKTGLAIKLEKEIGSIIDLLSPSLPRSLSIEAQGRFAIGYYHQTQARFSRATDQDIIDSDFAGVDE